MADKEIEALERKLIDFLKTISGAEHVFYDDMQELIRFALYEKDCTISLDWQ